MIFTSPPSPKAMIAEAFFVGLPSKRGLTTKSTPSTTSRDTPASPAGGASPEMLAEVETIGLPSPRSIRWQRPFLGDQVPGNAHGTREDRRQGAGRQFHYLEGDARCPVDVAHDHVGRGAQHEHRLLVFAPLEFVDAFHGLGVGRVAAQSPDRIGRVEDDTALFQHADSLVGLALQFVVVLHVGYFAGSISIQ